MPSYVITGASRGIGLEFVRQLSAEHGNQIFALVRNEATATKLFDLQKQAQNVRILQADIVDVKALKNAAGEVAKATAGSLDYLINNAAFVEEERRLLTLDTYPDGHEYLLEQDIQKSIHINVIGVVHTINSFLPLLRKSPIKKIITLSSGIGDLEFTLTSGVPSQAPYSISKAALNMTVAKYAVRFKGEGLLFLAISPGLVNTSTRAPTEEQLQGFQQMVALFKKAAPLWDGNPISPEQSVTAMLKVIDHATIEDTGAFISHFGNKEWL
ncbi:hypothetical protein AcV5_001958 [Taiwanofungus camphoratus]|nr:hypothetical protein AcV5_001958 [Antrodia cinnamomea]KAI0960719.1 hypothetical protein AcV7_000023 [Antrodia cinnamomea]